MVSPPGNPPADAERVQLDALTVNPLAPQSHRFDSARLRALLQQEIPDVPIFDVLAEDYPGSSAGVDPLSHAASQPTGQPSHPLTWETESRVSRFVSLSRENPRMFLRCRNIRPTQGDAERSPAQHGIPPAASPMLDGPLEHRDSGRCPPAQKGP